jgi:RNA polymerase sigma-70 factor (ECF subfamily)
MDADATDSVQPEFDVDATVELVQRARAGDQAAYDALFVRYEQRLRRWAHGRLPRDARGGLDTQDLVQETLVRVFQHIPTFEPRHPGAFRDYVWTTLWNRIRDIARSQARRGPSDVIGEDHPASSPSPLEEAIGQETLARYDAALERLKPEEREAVIARVELGLSHAEVAAALGKPSAAAAHMAVSRALVRLAEEMAHDRSRC